MLTDDDPTNNGAWDLTKGLLQGIYLDDNDQNGNDVPEITLQAELTAGASIGIPGFEAGAEGGIHGEVAFNLHTDPEQQGKIRYTDIVKQFQVNQPAVLLRRVGEGRCVHPAFVDTPLGRAEYPIASKTVYSKQATCSRSATPRPTRTAPAG